MKVALMIAVLLLSGCASVVVVVGDTSADVKAKLPVEIGGQP